ncbi:hypothetical protein [Ochrobactrum sp. AN78]|uniref:hypothetical protein n=1 Tax=Ochrobactrum sp. AN78 TaxID=3039853 RepID=UPI00298A039D|nr:hypothetical protein [Ochrobactrum sp. AN78]MDH7793615.1 hypothetical protein [Ochrobactrum sp. AN78]
MQESFSALAQRVLPQVLVQARPFTSVENGYCLFLSISDGSARAVTVKAYAASIEACWSALLKEAEDHLSKTGCLSLNGFGLTGSTRRPRFIGVN